MSAFDVSHIHPDQRYEALKANIRADDYWAKRQSLPSVYIKTLSREELEQLTLELLSELESANQPKAAP